MKDIIQLLVVWEMPNLSPIQFLIEMCWWLKTLEQKGIQLRMNAIAVFHWPLHQNQSLFVPFI